jgi:acyl carrier protein
MELLDGLNGIFREVFDDDNIKITPEMTASDVDGWDSLSHVNLIVAIESRFKITFSQKELLTFKNVGDLLNSIRSKIGSSPVRVGDLGRS